MPKASYFNPRSPCGERLQPLGPKIHQILNFNPRSPCGERRISLKVSKRNQRFQSTLPVWGATAFMIPDSSRKGKISIHAPRVGSDGQRVQATGSHNRDFNPRSPCGERLCNIADFCHLLIFQSTLPVWGATHMKSRIFGEIQISIHAPRVGSDSKDAQISGSIFGKDVKSVGHNPGKAVPNRFKSRCPLHRFPRKSCEPPGILCTLTLRATKSGYPPADRCSCSRNARLSFRIGSPDSRNGGCPFPDP